MLLIVQICVGVLAGKLAYAAVAACIVAWQQLKARRRMNEAMDRLGERVGVFREGMDDLAYFQAIGRRERGEVEFDSRRVVPGGQA